MTHGHKIYKIAAIFPVSMEYCGRILEDAIRYVQESEHLSLLELIFSDENPPSFDGELGFDAAILHVRSTDTWVSSLSGWGIPLINTSCDWPYEEIPSVFYESSDLINMAVKHLAAFTDGDLIYLCFGNEEHNPQLNTARLFVSAVQNRGRYSRYECLGENHPNSWVLNNSILMPEIESKIRDIIRSITPTAGILCHNDHLAYHVCRLAREMGLSIPSDLAVMGQRDYRIARCSKPAISSLPMGKGVGYRAIELLDRKLTKGEEIRPRNVVRIHPVEWRESTGGGDASISFIRKACEIIHRRARTGITAGEVARMVSVNPDLLRNHFLRIFGETPAELIRTEKTFRNIGGMRI